MSEGAISIKKAVPIIVLTWILSLVTTLALVYFAPSIFPPIGTNNIVDEAIITTKLPDGAVTSAKILNGAVTAIDLADGSIITAKIADGAVTTAKISDGAISSEKIADGAILTVKLADGSVTSAKIVDGTIIAADLATDSVSSIKIADGAVTTTKIADYAVSNIKLASEAIPFNSTYSRSTASTSSTSWADMPGMSVNMTLPRTSHLLIMFSSEAWLGAAGDYMLVRALVNSTEAYPTAGASLLVLTRVTFTDNGAYSYTFYLPNVSAGVYTVKIQWRMYSGSTSGSIEDRTLSVIALPA